jgi:hypothetical protein
MRKKFWSKPFTFPTNLTLKSLVTTMVESLFTDTTASQNGEPPTTLTVSLAISSFKTQIQKMLRSG